MRWRHMTGAERILEVLLTRRSVSPRRLQPPGPNPEELDGLLQAGLRAPDHGALHPWRVIEFRPASGSRRSFSCSKQSA
ncbi:nitroreductase family protein, partial [Variovorax sp. CT11-76]